ncbi:polysaccharide pyruvyl transferase family protein [Methylomonas sp. HW2-6]|uniref:polysaccharide pyruvyl transferase family protein n=1 Tax=Methylomonas sp. HW2-6 TaxID=3376687 RepID=UPI0040432B8A
MTAVHNEIGLNELCSTLKELKNYSVIRYIPNHGNAGDGLIAAAAWQLFDRLGLLSSIQVNGEISPGDVVIFSGGGNFIPEYSQARNVIEKSLQQNVSKFILLPHSIRGNEDILQKLDKRFYLFCREKESYEHAQKYATNANVFLTHDLVFGLDLVQLNQRLNINWLRLQLLLHPRLLKAYLNWRQALLKIKPKSDGTMTLMRVDVEAKQAGKYPSELDISSKHSSYYSQRFEADLIAREFLATLDQADHIISDRLHVSIASALLGKKLTMFDNSYGKNRNVFLNSMDGRFDNLEFKTD